MRRLLHLTDTHILASREGTLRGTPTADTLKRVLDHAAKRLPSPDAVLITGDLVQDEEEAAYTLFRDFFAGFRCPVFCLPGNHDDPALMRSVLSGAPFRLDARTSLGDWEIIQLNSHVPGQAGGRLGQEALAWLDGVLADIAPRPALIAVHHPPVPLGTAWLDRIGLADGEALLGVLDCHEHARALLWGHAHQTWDSRRGHLQLIGTPSTCAQFLPGSRTFALDPAAPPAYRVLELRDDGSFDSELVTL
jgi:3',5'-cyclic-AMP phosphodiesterase